jgi:hypothetical protein
VRGINPASAGMKAFNALAKYIFGGNAAGPSVSTLVRVAMAPGWGKGCQQSSCCRHTRVGFVGVLGWFAEMRHSKHWHSIFLAAMQAGRCRIVGVCELQGLGSLAAVHQVSIEVVSPPPPPEGGERGATRMRRFSLDSLQNFAAVDKMA